VSGAICAKLAPALSSNSSDPTARLFNATSHYRPGEGHNQSECVRLLSFAAISDKLRIWKTDRMRG
jgi:hypothetical protein